MEDIRMSYIRVDHSKFETAAVSIDNYVEDMKRNMSSAENEVSTLSASWQGQDFNQFNNQWSKLTDSSSVHTQMVKSMESYAKFLRYAAKQYKDAQANAVNRANSLPQ